MKRILLILLIFDMCYGADKYVATTGSDGGAGTEGDPYLNIAQGYEGVTSGSTIWIADGTYDDGDFAARDYLIADDGKTVTIRSTSGDRTAVIWNGVNGEIYLIRQVSVLGNITIKDLTLTSNGGGTSGLIYNDMISNSVGDYTIDNCVMNCGVAEAYFQETATNAIGSVTFTNCNITSAHPSVVFSFNGLGSVTINNSTIVASAGIMFQIVIDCDNIFISGNTLSTTSGTDRIISISGAATEINSIIISNNIMISAGEAFDIDDFANIVSVLDNTITITSSLTGIQIGGDSAGPDTNQAIVRPVIKGNTITYAPGTGGHGILISEGVVNGEISYNKVLVNNVGSSVGIVIKGTNHNIHHNIARGTTGLLLKGAQECSVFNNTLLTNATDALRWIDGVASRTASNNIIMYNIIDGDGGTYAIKSENDRHGQNFFDFNLYRTGSTGVSHLGNADQATLAAMQAKWQTATGWIESEANVFGVLADQNSSVADPLLNTDYTLKTNSPALNFADDTLASGKGAITLGAWQPNVNTKGNIYRSRYDSSNGIYR